MEKLLRLLRQNRTEEMPPASFMAQVRLHVTQQLWLQVLIGLALGALVGIAIGPDVGWVSHTVSSQVASWLAFPGYFFLSVLQMVVIPLVITSIIVGIAHGDDAEMMKSLSWRVVIYFLMTTTIAVSIGLAVTLLLQPGSYIDINMVSYNAMDFEEPALNPALTDATNIPKRLISLIPRNPFAAIAAGDMLSIVIFAVFFGFAFARLSSKRSAAALQVCASVQDACMVLVGWIVRLAPFAVFGLIAEAVTRIGLSALGAMAMYVLTVLLGLIGVLIMYALIVWIVAGRSPIAFFSAIGEAQLIAFSTSSSSATMPVTLRVAKEKLGIDNIISRFTIPLGTTINMDGTALYQTVATVFLAHVFQVDLSFADMLIVLILAIAASIGTPGTPGVGIIILATILASVGIPPAGIALIIGVDRILDMCRTTVNVTGDLTATAVMARLLKHKKSLSEKVKSTVQGL